MGWRVGIKMVWRSEKNWWNSGEKNNVHCKMYIYAGLKNWREGCTATSTVYTLYNVPVCNAGLKNWREGSTAVYSVYIVDVCRVEELKRGLYCNLYNVCTLYMYAGLKNWKEGCTATSTMCTLYMYAGLENWREGCKVCWGQLS